MPHQTSSKLKNSLESQSLLFIISDKKLLIKETMVHMLDWEDRAKEMATLLVKEIEEPSYPI